MDGVLTWMEASRLARFILETSWVFPTLETVHFIGLILLVGSILVVDLRTLGVASSVPLGAFVRFIPVSVIGFGLNLITGILFLFADPFRYYPNLSFRLKMLAILLAGLNAVWFKLVAESELTGKSAAGSGGPTLKFIAAASIFLWTAVIVLGRMIPYLE